MREKLSEKVEIIFITIEDVIKKGNPQKLSILEESDKELLESLLLSEPLLFEGYLVVEAPIYDLFRTAKINKHSDKKTIEMLSYPNAFPDITKVEVFTNFLYDLLKNETISQGRFKNSDKDYFGQGNWTGKLWVDYASTTVIELKLEKNILSFWLITHS